MIEKFVRRISWILWRSKCNEDVVGNRKRRG